MRTHKLIIHGRLIGLNDYIRLCRGNKYSSARWKKSLEGNILLSIKTQLSGIQGINRAKLKFSWYEKDMRRDPDNVAFAKKFIEDALVTGGVLVNDGWKNIAGLSDEFHIDSKNPRIEVEIVDLGE